MYISDIQIENFRCFGEAENKFHLSLSPGLTALVGENDTGKTAVIDALRFVFGTRDQEYFRLEESDFHCPPGGGERTNEIRICCCLEGLSASEKGAFAEFLTYVDKEGKPDAILWVHWTAKDKTGARTGRRSIFAETRTGKDGDGPVLDAEARDMLRATYLRPLRDAERALSAGRGSRLSEILRHTKEIRESGSDYNEKTEPQPADTSKLSVLGVGDYASKLLRDREGIKLAKTKLNDDYLKPLSFAGDDLQGDIDVSAAGDDDMRLRKLLERLELTLQTAGLGHSSPNRGLGSNNLLFMACELLLLGAERDELPLLLIEEPEAHLHPQRQLRLMQFLQDQAKGNQNGGSRSIQIILSTHSPNLASAIHLDNLVLIQGSKGYALSRGNTQLSYSDYRFLERFLDVTKANLFFARGIIIVEGDAENILIPTIARIIGQDFGEHGVSVVNVGGTGLRRFARIYQRKNPEKDGKINVPVSCIADLDVMPDCAPEIVGVIKQGQEIPEIKDRRWRKESDFTPEQLKQFREKIEQKASGQNVATFVSDEWTLEYDLAHAGLAEQVWVSAILAESDEQINDGKKHLEDVVETAKADFTELIQNTRSAEELASHVYSRFTTGKKASKAIAAQHLAEILKAQINEKTLDASTLRGQLPGYLVKAIDHVAPPPPRPATEAAAATGDADEENTDNG